MLTGDKKRIIELSVIPPDVWTEFSRAVRITGGMNAALWVAYRQLPVLFSLSPIDVIKLFQERGGTCKTL